MNHSKWLGLFILVLTLSVGGYSTAEGGHGHNRDKRLTEELNLTTTQQEQLKDIREKYRESIKSKRAAMKEARHKLKESMQSNANDATLRKEHDQVSALKSEYKKARFEEVLAIRAILTPEQRKKFKAMRHDRRGHKGHHGPGPDKK